MTLRVLAMGLLLTCSALLPVAPAHAAPAMVSINNLTVSPAQLTVRLGKAVKWTNNDDLIHTVTSDQGFFNSGNLQTGGTFQRSFRSSGTFAYHCMHHSSVTGKVAVRLAASPLSGGTAWTIRWGLDAAPEGQNYDVQFRRKSADQWRSFKRDATIGASEFGPARPGTFKFRGRTSIGDLNSGWSPVKTVRVS